MAVFFAGTAISSAFYFSGRPIRFADAVISNFLSPTDNPYGYLAAALGTMVAALLLAPSALLFYRRMSEVQKAGALAGTAFYAAGLLAAMLIGLLAPVRGLDFSVHLVLAYAAFMSLQTGISIYLALAACKRNRPLWLRTLVAAEWVVPSCLLALSFGSDWPGSTAFCEWGLCATIAGGLWLLTTNSCS